jgi:hypothetical protein
MRKTRADRLKEAIKQLDYSEDTYVDDKPNQTSRTIKKYVDKKISENGVLEFERQAPSDNLSAMPGVLLLHESGK